MTNSAELDKDIKELEDKLSSLKADRQLLKAQESLARDKASSLLEDGILSSLLKKLQESLVKYELGLALNIDYKRNWVFLVINQDSNDGLSSYKILDPKDKRIFYGLVDSFNQVTTFEGIQLWLQSSLKLLKSLKTVKDLVEVDGATLTFNSYDNVLDKLTFTYTTKYMKSYTCVLVVKRPYVLTVDKLLTFDSEFCSVRFKNSNIHIQTKADIMFVREEDYTGTFKQILSVHQSFTAFKDLGKVIVELEKDLVEFYSNLDVMSR